MRFTSAPKGTVREDAGDGSGGGETIRSIDKKITFFGIVFFLPEKIFTDFIFAIR